MMLQKPPIPPDETERIEALNSYDILDTEPERAYDDITRLASYICGTPISLVSLIDDNRQWFKSRVGLSVSETPRDVAFCAHAILHDDLCIVSDASVDARFASNPLVIDDPKIRFYAGAPLKTSSGHNLGTLCVIDRIPRVLTTEQREALRALSRQVVTLLELRRNVKILKDLYAERRRVQMQRDRFFSLSLDLLCVAGFDGYFKQLNPSWERVLGYSQQELMSRPFIEFVHPEDRQATASEAAKLQAGKNTIAFENRYICKDGSTRWFLWTASTSKKDQLLIAVARDITDRKLQEQKVSEQARLAAFAADIGIALTRGDTLDAKLQECASAMVHHLEGSLASIWTVGSKGDMLQLRASAETSPMGFQHLSSIPIGKYRLGRVARDRTPYLGDLNSGFDTDDRDWASKNGIVSFACHPLITDNALIGVIGMYSREPISPETFGVLGSVSDEIALGIAKAIAVDELKASEARIRSILDNMLGGLITIDTQGIIESVNPSGERIFGYREEELKGQHLKILLPPSVADPNEFLQKAHCEAIGNVTEWEGMKKNGRVFPFEISLFEFQTSEGRRFAGNIRDITEQREIERMKDEFIAMVSHELRTPLTSIRGSLGLLASGVMGTLPQEASETLEIAERNTLRLIDLINDILDLEKLEGGKMEIHLHPVSLDVIFKKALEATNGFADQRGVHIETDPCSISVFVDEQKLIQVLVNLLSNAIKFSPNGSHVFVSGLETQYYAEIRVTDQGRGIPVEFHDSIFQRFKQVDASDSRAKGGTGLGLAICRAIVERHGGSIGLESKENEGSTFWFRVPLATKPDEEKHEGIDY